MRTITVALYACLASILIFAAACGDDDQSNGEADTGTTDVSTDADVGEDTTAPDMTEPDVDGDPTDDPTDDPTNDTGDDPDVALGEACDDGPPVPVLGAQGLVNTDACLDCMVEECCEEMDTCQETAVCFDLRTCFSACPDDGGACNEGCVATHGGSPENGAVVDCRQDRCGFDCSANSCVGSVVWGEPAVDEYEATHTFVDFQTGSRVVGATIRVCEKSDTECDSPLQEVISDDEGQAILTLPSAPEGVDAFINVTGEGIIPMDFWYAAADPTRIANGTGWNVVSESTFELVTGVLGVSADPARGSVAFIASDCNQLATAGLTVTADTADDDSLRFYIVSGLPNATLTETQRGGAGAIVNLPEGATTLTATGPDGEPWGSVEVTVRAGHMVGTNVVPSP